MEHLVVDMTRGPETSLEALAILDFHLGDEWAGMTHEYATEWLDVAIQILESAGMVMSLQERYRKFIHNYLWED